MIIKERLTTFNRLVVFVLVVGFTACKVSDKSASKDLHSFPLHSAIEISEDSLTFDKNQGVVFYNNAPFSGTSFSIHENGIKAKSIQYLKGKRNGVYIKWFDTGGKSFEANYTDGKQDGLSTTWWRNGNLRSQSRFQKGIAHGLQKQWYKNGAKFKEQNLVNGQEEGYQRSWRENGKIYNNYEAKNGRIFGLKRSKLCYELDDEELQVSNN